MQLEYKDAMKKEFQRLQSLEFQLYDALKMLSHAAQSPELKRALDDHREQTKVQLQRLHTIGDRMGFPVVGLPNLPMKALALEFLQDWGGAEPGPVTDALIIGGAQKGEHLEIAWYGFLRSLCQKAGDEESAALLQTSLDEEKASDELLSKIAESLVNPAAAAAPTPPTVPSL